MLRRFKVNWWIESCKVSRILSIVLYNDFFDFFFLQSLVVEGYFNKYNDVHRYNYNNQV